MPSRRLRYLTLSRRYRDMMLTTILMIATFGSQQYATRKSKKGRPIRGMLMEVRRNIVRDKRNKNSRRRDDDEKNKNRKRKMGNIREGGFEEEIGKVEELDGRRK